MKALRFSRVGQSEIVDISKPIPKPDEVLIRVKAAGICASDIMAFKGKHSYRIPPVITGHELAGEIVERGSGISTLKIGDRVAVEPHIGCGTCALCRQGHYNECPNKRLLGVGDWIGAFSEYVVAAEPMCHPMPGTMSFEEGAALEPLCVGLHAVQRANLRIGERIAVLGCGAIGMMTLLCAKLSGPEKIIVTDISPFKRETALGNGADEAVDPLNQDPVQEVLKATGGAGADTVFVAVSHEAVLDQALRMCKRMGQVVLIASFGEKILFAPRDVQLYERSLIGTLMYTSDDYRTAIALWGKGELDIRPLITRRIRLDQAPPVVAAMADGSYQDAVKTVITFD